MDLVDCVGPTSGRYFISIAVEMKARESAESYLDYAFSLFEDFFVDEVALHCSFGVPCVGVPHSGDFLANLPAEAASVLIGTLYISHVVLHF